jgi:hypothetical protein
VGFSLPQATETFSIHQTWPVAVAQVFVGVQKIGDMKVSSPQITDSREVNTDGQSFIMGTGGRLNAGDTLVLDFSGLPAHSQTPRYAALSLAVGIFVVGGWFAFGMKRAPATSDTGLLKAQRDKLMTEVVALERRRRERGLSETETARMHRLSANLERIMADLDRGAAA